MRNVLIIIYFLLGTGAAQLLSSCAEKEIIPAETLSEIISQMYLADQYVEANPALRAQADSTALYESIFRKYGYDAPAYRKSLAYYLQKGNAYKKINQRAREILMKRKNELNDILQKIHHYQVSWWVLDSIRTKDIYRLRAYPYLRAVKWFVLPDEPSGWIFTDTSEADIPGNIRWWITNASIFSDSLHRKYPVLLKHYWMEKEKEEPAYRDTRFPAGPEISRLPARKSNRPTSGEAFVPAKPLPADRTPRTRQQRRTHPADVRAQITKETE